MGSLPRRLPPTPEQRLKIILERYGSSVAGITRFEGAVSPTPTVTPPRSNKVYVQTDEPTDAAVGDLWTTSA